MALDPKTFTNRVRAREIPQPINRNFSIDQWRAEARKSAVSEEDGLLAKAGEWVWCWLEEVRRQLRFVRHEDLDPSDKRRVLIGFANQQTAWISARAKKEIDAISNVASAPVVGNEVIQLSLQTATGASYSVDELQQNVVDGVERCVRAIPESVRVPGRNIRPEDREDVRWDTNMGILYRWLESIWIECVWSGYYIRPDGDTDYIVPRDPALLDWEVVSRHRRDQLVHEFALGGYRYLGSNLGHGAGKKAFRRVRVIGSERKGRNSERYRLVTPSIKDSNVIQGIVVRTLAEERYVADVLAIPLPDNKRVTLSKMLDAWQVLQSLAFIHLKSIGGLREDSLIQEWAPLVDIVGLERAVSASLGVSINDAKYLVSRLTFHGHPTEEFWAQPLVALREGQGVLAIGAIATVNLSRVVNVWMRQCGLDLDQRGPLFEKYVRNKLMSYARKSTHLRGVSVSSKAIHVPIESGGVEEIDAILVIGRTVVVIEAKCFLEPADAIEICNYKAKVDLATKQVLRKVSAVSSDIEALQVAASRDGLVIPRNALFIPLVLLNGPMHAGFAHNDVAVVDLPIVERYFEGGMSDVSKVGPDGSLVELNRIYFYRDAIEAESNIANYLLRPPQTELRVKSIRSRELPIAPLRADWRPAVQVLRECHVDYSARLRELNSRP